MKDRDTKLIWEQYESPGREGDPKKSIPFPDGRGEMGEREAASYPNEDEHNPPDNPEPNSGDVYSAMDRQHSFDHIASQYRDLEEDELESRLATLKSHIDVLEDLLEMDDAHRRAAQGQG